ncbi:MAG: hypothetical protein K9M99_02860 [Candidatus Cloacimonetes bacterium]|nr:hypothetical protein [Candidatus Cloacimonadota bacterium]
MKKTLTEQYNFITKLQTESYIEMLSEPNPSKKEKLQVIFDSYMSVAISLLILIRLEDKAHVGLPEAKDKLRRNQYKITCEAGLRQCLQKRLGIREHLNNPRLEKTEVDKAIFDYMMSDQWLLDRNLTPADTSLIISRKTQELTQCKSTCLNDLVPEDFGEDYIEGHYKANKDIL